MVARGRGGRLAEADATEGVRSAAWQVGGGTLICLDLPQQEDWSGADPRRPSDELTPFQMNMPLLPYKPSRHMLLWTAASDLRPSVESF
jgi:hypothetical protein